MGKAIMEEFWRKVLSLRSCRQQVTGFILKPYFYSFVLTGCSAHTSKGSPLKWRSNFEINLSRVVKTSASRERVCPANLYFEQGAKLFVGNFSATVLPQHKTKKQNSWPARNFCFHSLFFYSSFFYQNLLFGTH